jgi:hypothetical protein
VSVGGGSPQVINPGVGTTTTTEAAVKGTGTTAGWWLCRYHVCSDSLLNASSTMLLLIRHPTAWLSHAGQTPVPAAAASAQPYCAFIFCTTLCCRPMHRCSTVTSWRAHHHSCVLLIST